MNLMWYRIISVLGHTEAHLGVALLVAFWIFHLISGPLLQTPSSKTQS